MRDDQGYGPGSGRRAGRRARRRRVADRAGGSPLTLVETLHFLVDSGIVDTHDPDRWRIADQSLGELAIPATIQGIARQPEAQPRLYGTMFLIIGLCESAYFINLAFMALFVINVVVTAVGIQLTAK